MADNLPSTKLVLYLEIFHSLCKHLKSSLQYQMPPHPKVSKQPQTSLAFMLAWTYWSPVCVSTDQRERKGAPCAYTKPHSAFKQADHLRLLDFLT